MGIPSTPAASSSAPCTQLPTSGPFAQIQPTDRCLSVFHSAPGAPARLAHPRECDRQAGFSGAWPGGTPPATPRWAPHLHTGLTPAAGSAPPPEPLSLRETLPAFAAARAPGACSVNASLRDSANRDPSRTRATASLSPTSCLGTPPLTHVAERSFPATRGAFVTAAVGTPVYVPLRLSPVLRGLAGAPGRAEGPGLHEWHGARQGRS